MYLINSFSYDLGVKSKREKEESRLLSRASKSRLIRDLMDESTIIDSTRNTQNIQNDDTELEERLHYKEENFIRLIFLKKI